MFRVLSQVHLLGAAVFGCCVIFVLKPKVCDPLSGCVIAKGEANGTRVDVFCARHAVECSGWTLCCTPCLAMYDNATSSSSSRVVAIEMQYRLAALATWAVMSVALQVVLHVVLLCVRRKLKKDEEEDESYTAWEVGGEFFSFNDDDKDFYWDDDITFPTEGSSMATTTAAIEEVGVEKDSELRRGRQPVPPFPELGKKRFHSVVKFFVGGLVVFAALNLGSLYAATVEYIVARTAEVLSCHPTFLFIGTFLAVYLTALVEFIGITIPPLRENAAKRLWLIKKITNVCTSLIFLWWIFLCIYSYGMFVGRW